MSGTVSHGFFGPARESLLRYLTTDDSAGALLTGGVGAGKNRLAHEVLRALPPETVIHRIQASPSLQDIELGAVALLLGTPAGSLSMAEAISRLRLEWGVAPGVGAYSRRREGLPLLVVDRAEFLDAATSFVLAQLAQSRAVRLLLIGSAARRTEVRLESVLSVGQLAVVTLDGMSEDGIAEMCSTLLGGRASRGTVKAFQQLSGGLPVIAEACVRAARDKGLLARSGGTWALGSDDLAGHGEVESAVYGLHGDRQGPENDAFVLLALAGPQTGDVIFDITGVDPELLRGSGLVRTELDGKLSLRSTIHAEVLRRTTLPGRSTSLQRRWSAANPASWDFRQMLWAINCAVEMPGEHLLPAVQDANNRGEFAAALQLCRVARRFDDHDVGLERVRALEGLGRFSAARTIIEGHDCAEAGAGRGCVPRTIRHLSILLGSRAGSEDLLRAARSWDVPGSGHPQDAIIAACISSARLAAALETRHVPPDAQDRVRSLVACGDQDIALGALGMAAEYLVFDGPELLELAAPLTAGLSAAAPSTASRLLTHLATTLLLGGHTTELEETIDRLVGLPGPLRFAHHELAAFFDGWQRMREGSLDDGRKIVRTTIPGLGLHGLADFERLARLTGEEGNGDESPRPAWSQGRASHWAPGGRAVTLPERLAELFEATRRPGPSVRTELERLITEYRDEGQELLEAEALLEGLNLDIIGSTTGTDADAIERLLYLVTRRGGEWSMAVAHVARSWLSDDPRAWLSAATAVESSAHPGLALVAWARVVVGSEAGEDPKRRGLALRRLHSLQDAVGPEALPVVRRALDAGDLTEREEEILKHAAVGLSNREIARELTLSQRTVEGHLYRIFTKLGVSERAELVHFA